MGVQIPRCFEARAHLKVNWELLDPRVQGRYQSFDSTTVFILCAVPRTGIVIAQLWARSGNVFARDSLITRARKALETREKSRQKSTMKSPKRHEIGMENERSDAS